MESATPGITLLFPLMAMKSGSSSTFSYNEFPTTFINQDKGTTVNDELRKHTKTLHEIAGKMNYQFEVFGDDLAKREGYKNLDGIDAIHYYLIHKFSWLPRDVKSMSMEDLQFVLSQELEVWSAPA